MTFNLEESLEDLFRHSVGASRTGIHLNTVGAQTERECGRRESSV